MYIIIRNCKLYLDNNIIDNCFIAIRNGKIVDYGKDHSPLSSWDALYDAKGHLVLPGLVDVHVHLRDQMLSYKEDFRSGTASAALGGVTSVIDMPNNNPPTNSPERLKERMAIAKSKIIVNVGFTAMPSDDKDINKALVHCGAKAFKMFLYHYIENGNLNINQIESIMKSLSDLNRRLMIHCGFRTTYHEVLNLVKTRGLAKQCKIENKLAKLILSLALKHGVKVHFCHVSCPSIINTIMQQKHLMEVTSEVTIHHMLLDYKVLNVMGSIAHVDPPLKSSKTARLLLKYLRKGLIDIVVSDHAPHTLNEKTEDDPKPGFPNLQLMMPLLLTEVKRGTISLSDVVIRGSLRPAKIFGFKERGAIKIGYWADLVEVDLKTKFKIRSDILISKSKYTPFEGRMVIGMPIRTFVNGICVNENYEVVGKGGEGQIIMNGG